MQLADTPRVLPPIAKERLAVSPQSTVISLELRAAAGIMPGIWEEASREGVVGKSCTNQPVAAESETGGGETTVPALTCGVGREAHREKRQAG